MIKAKPYTHLGLYLRSKREKYGFSQKEISDKMGYSSTQFVSNWERGISSPPLDALSKLIPMYQIDKQEFVNVMLEDKKNQIETSLKEALKKAK